MIEAKPNLNGNSPDDFRGAFVALGAAREAVQGAMRAVKTDIVNGRNYQHMIDPDTALVADKRCVEGIARQIDGLIGELQSAIVDALGAD